MVQVEHDLAPYEDRPIYHRQLSPSDAEPVPIPSIRTMSESQAQELIARYERAGFAVYRLLDEEPTAESVEGLATALDLGQAFVPPMYLGTSAGATYSASGINSLSARPGAANHPAFEAANGQELHSDGTLQPIGHIKTTLLQCVLPAADGGDSTVFNAVAAFTCLAEDDPAAARALRMNCLRRTQNYGERRDTHLGPAFSIWDGEIISRYSVTSTDTWDPDPDVDLTALHHAVRFMSELARPGSGYWLQFRMEAGEGLMIANDKISHGRTSFQNAAGRPRKMFRGLYLQRPRFNLKP